MNRLKGKKIFISRDEEKAHDFIEPLKNKGALVFPIPLTTFKRWDNKDNEEILKQLSDFEWIVFTSANGVNYFFETLERYQISLKHLSNMQFAVIGTKTEQTLQQYAIKADFVPEIFDADHFSEAFIHEMNPDDVLLVKGNLSRTIIDDALTEQGINFHNLYVYQTVVNTQAKKDINQLVLDQDIDAWVFTSPSSLIAFRDLLDHRDEKVLSYPCFCIGETTQTKAKEIGFKYTNVPKTYTLEGLSNLVIDFYSRKE